MEDDSMTLSSNIEPVTDLEWLRTYDPAELVKFTNLNGPIVLEGVMDEAQHLSFFSIPWDNLPPNASYRIEFFEDESEDSRVFDTGPTPAGDIKPLGIWRAGIDPYGVFENEPLNTGRTFWLDELTKVKRWRLTIDHGYSYTPPETTTIQNPPVITETQIPDGIFRQNDDGVLSMESTSGEIVDGSGGTWETQSDSNASEGNTLLNNASTIYPNGNAGPRVVFEFTASRSGNHDVWVRLRSTQGNSAYCVFNNHAQYFQFPFGSSYVWKKVRSAIFTENNRHTLAFAARDHFVYFDKMVVLPSGSPSPAGVGPPESGEGFTTVTTIDDGGVITTTSAASTDSVLIRNIMMGNSFETASNFGFGSTIKFLTEPELRITHNGRAITARPQRLSRQVSLSMNQMPETDRLNLWQLEAGNRGKPFLFSAYPSQTGWFAGNYTFLAKFPNSLVYTHANYDRHQTKIEFIEA